MKQERKRILFLFYRFPYPPFGGDTYKGYNIIKELSKYHDISIISLIQDELKYEYKVEFEKYTSELTTIKISKIQSIFYALRFLFNRKPIQLNYFYSKQAQMKISNALTKFDVVIPVTIRMHQYIKNTNKIVLFDAVDSISLNYEKSIKNVKNYFWKLIYWIEQKRLFEAEKNAVIKSAYTFFVNYQESLFWSKFGKTIPIPNGVHNEVLNFKATNLTEENSIVFFGKMDYQPNLDALAYLVDKILPLLDGDIKVKVIGLDPRNLCAKKYKSIDRVEVLGFLENPYSEIIKSLAAVLPMQTGGGIQNKILQCMAIGQIVITSSLGANPIKNAKNGQQILVANEEQEYADFVNKIKQNRTAFKGIGQDARALILQEYSWSIYGERLNNLIQEAAAKK